MQTLNPEDMISRLPDDVLILIISLIPTKEALTTRVLSNRWRDVFRFMSAITFRTACKYPCACNSDEYINGVCKVLQSHSAHILSFDLRCCLSESFARTIEQCIVSLGDLGIQKLSLRIPKTIPISKRFEFSFSFSLLSLMPSLQNFKLSHHGSWLPSLKTSCNSLKTLRLTFVSFPPGSFDCILSNCSSLCTLSIKRCKVPSKLCFPPIDLQLKCIAIHYCLELEEMDLYAPNLTTFELLCKNAVKLNFAYVPQLQSVYLISIAQHQPYFCDTPAKYLPTLKNLLLQNIEDIYQDGSFRMGIDMFRKLKRLEFTVSTTYCNLFSLILVVHECQLLEEFRLATMADRYLWPSEEEKQMTLHSRLKVVEISGFGGHESQVRFVKYILKSAVNLQQMIISCYMSHHLGCGKWVVSDWPPSNCKKWSQLYECIQHMKVEAVYKTLQVVAREFPQPKSKQF